MTIDGQWDVVRKLHNIEDEQALKAWQKALFVMGDTKIHEFAKTPIPDRYGSIDLTTADQILGKRT